MKLPPAHTASDAIRSLASLIREGVVHSRTEPARQLKARAIAMLRESYEGDDLSEVIFPISRVGATDELPGSSVIAASPGVNLMPDETQGLDRLVLRPGFGARLIAPMTATFPATWSAQFYERVAWPPEQVSEGMQSHRFFVEIKRGGWKMVLPIHDTDDKWTGAEFKAKPPFPFPIELGFPFRGYVVIGNNMRDRTLCRWLTVYLAQRSFLTKDEEEDAFNAFFVDGRAILLSARWKAYDRIKRRFVQPIGGRPSFSTYLAAATSGLVKELRAEEQGWGDDAKNELTAEDQARGDDAENELTGEGQGWADEDDGEPTTDEQGTRDHDTAGSAAVLGHLVDLSRLRWQNPSLHRALLDRIDRGRVQCVALAGRTYIHANDVDGVDRERVANADDRRPKRFGPEQRAAWRRRLTAGGLSDSTAHRTVARWINHDVLTADEIEARIAKPHRARSKPSGDPTT